jgi:hypothetical protein
MHRTVHGAALNRMVQGEPPGLPCTARCKDCVMHNW